MATQQDAQAQWQQMHAQAQALQAMADQLEQPTEGITRAELEIMAEQVQQMQSNVEKVLRAKASREGQPKAPASPSVADAAGYRAQPQERKGSPKAKANPGGSPQLERRPDNSFGSLRNFLNDLWNEDARCIFIARGIKQLGFKSKQLLERHFSGYGSVSHVFVPTSKTKANLRPGNLGVVVMSSAEVVERIFSEDQVIRGVRIELAKYERPVRSDGEQQQEPSSTVEAPPKVQRNRQQGKPVANHSYGAQMPRHSAPLHYDNAYDNGYDVGHVAGPRQDGVHPLVLADVARQLTHLQSALHQINTVSMQPQRLPQKELYEAIVTLNDTQQHLDHLGQSCRQMALSQQLATELNATNHVDGLSPYAHDMGYSHGAPWNSEGSMGGFAPNFQLAASRNVPWPPLAPPDLPPSVLPPPPPPPLENHDETAADWGHGHAYSGAAETSSPEKGYEFVPEQQSGLKEDAEEDQDDGCDDDDLDDVNEMNNAGASMTWGRFTSPGERYWG